MIVKFETTLQEINKIWNNLSITKEDIFNIMDILPVKKEHEAINVDSISGTLYFELTDLPKDLTLAEFTLETLKSSKLSLITFGDEELALPLYQIYQKKFSHENIKLCYYIVSNINQTLNRFFNTNHHSFALLSETLYEQDLNKKISFFSTNKNFLTQNNIIGQEKPLTLEEKEQVILNLPITTFLNHVDNIKQNSLDINIDIPDSNQNKINYFNKNSNYFQIAKKSPNDKKFILEFFELFSNNLFEDNLSSNSLFVKKITTLLGINHSDFPSQEPNTSILKSFFNNIIEYSDVSILQDKEIVEAIANTYHERNEISFYSNALNSKIKDFLISNFQVFLNMKNDNILTNIFVSFPKFTKMFKNIVKIEKNNKEPLLNIISFISPEIEKFYSDNLDNIDEILTPNKKAIKDFACKQIINSNTNFNSADNTLCLIAIFPLLSKEEQLEHQLTFLKGINSSSLIQQNLTHIFFKNINFFSTYKDRIFSKINLEYLEEHKEDLSLTLKPFETSAYENDKLGKLHIYNIFFKLFTNEIKNWIKTKDYSVTNALFLSNLFKGKPILDGIATMFSQQNYSDKILEDSFEILKKDIKKLTVNDFEQMFSEIKKMCIVFKEGEGLKGIQHELVNLSTLTHYYFRKMYPDLKLWKTLKVDTSNYLDYSIIFPKYLTSSLFNAEMLHDFKIDQNSVENFRKMIKFPGMIEGINNNFSELKNLKDFFLNIDNIKLHIPSSIKTPLANKQLFLGNVYTKSDVANIFKQMGNDYSWISLSPFTFVAKAPQNVKNDPHFWIYIIQNLSSKTSILNFTPLNMAQDPLVLEAAIEKFKNDKDVLIKTFPILNNLKTDVVLKTLESPNNKGLNQLIKFHPEAYNKIIEKYPNQDNDFIADKLNEIIIKATSIDKSSITPKKTIKF